MNTLTPVAPAARSRGPRRAAPRRPVVPPARIDEAAGAPTAALMPYPRVEPPAPAAGALSAWRLTVTDLFDVAGYPTSVGNPMLLAMSGVRSRTAPAVRALLAGGARWVGKTRTDELSYSISGRNAHFGTPLNGAAPGRVPGGAASGAASAVSTGLCDLALATDAGGSVRVPASHCGLFGLRTTLGRGSLAECRSVFPSFDALGLMAREPRALLAATAVLVGEDPLALPPVPRLIVADDAFDRLESPVREALLPARRRIVSLLRPAGPPDRPLDTQADVHGWAFRHLQGRDAWESLGEFIERMHPPLGPELAQRIDWARTIDDTQVAQARRVQRALRARLSTLLDRDGVLLLPTMPDIAPRLNEDESLLERYRMRATRLLCLASLAGLPQVTMPMVRRLGAPLGLSLIGPAGSDLSLVRLAAALAAA